MQSFLEPYRGYIYAAMRIALAFIYVCHGLQKLFGLFGGRQQPLTSLLGVASIIETIGGTLIAVGLFTPITAFVCAGQMAVAHFVSHFPRAYLPIVNQGELSVVLAFAFLYIAANGSGPFALDRVLFRSR